VGVTLIKHQAIQKYRLRREQKRAGLSLIEVIACTTIVAVLLIPIAAIVKDSGKTIRLLETDATVPQSLRSGSNWLRDTIRPSSILAIQSNLVRIRLPNGKSVSIFRKGRDLVMDDGVTASVVCKDIQDVRFQPLLTADVPAKRVGLQMTISARDVATGALSSLPTTVANAR
jgi:hypothetical protein